MRKLSLILFFAVIAVSASAQLQITGKLRTLGDLKLSIEDIQGKVIVECNVVNGKEFKTKKVDITEDLYILKIGDYSEPILLTNTPIRFIGFFNDKDTNNNSLSISGTELNEQCKQFIAGYGKERSYIDGKKSRNYIDSHKNENPLVYATAIYLNERFITNYETFSYVLEKFPKESKSLLVAQIAKGTTSREKYREGGEAVDWTLCNEDGKEVSLNDLRGKIVLLDFWASWCGPCRAEMKSLQKIYSEIKGDDLVFVSVSLDDSREKWLKALEEDKIPWLTLWDSAGFKESKLRVTYGFNSIPFIVLIDKEGKTIARRLRGENVKTAIENLRTRK